MSYTINILLFSLLSGSLLIAQEPTPAAEASWGEVLTEIVDSGYPQRFIDSLKDIHNVSFPRGLRRIHAPFLNHPEDLVFSASWGFVKAGYARLSYSPDTGDGVAFFTIHAATSKFVGTFYRVRDFLRSTVDADGIYPLFFEEHVEEGRYRAHRWALFDHLNATTYTYKKGADSITTPRLTLDFLSFLYNLRTMTLVPNDTFTLNCYADGKYWPVLFRVGKRCQISIRSGTFNCIPILPRLAAEGRIFSKKDNIIIYLTDDNVHMPVLIKAKIRIGSIVAELIHFDTE